MSIEIEEFEIEDLMADLEAEEAAFTAAVTPAPTPIADGPEPVIEFEKTVASVEKASAEVVETMAEIDAIEEIGSLEEFEDLILDSPSSVSVESTKKEDGSIGLKVNLDVSEAVTKLETAKLVFDESVAPKLTVGRKASLEFFVDPATFQKETQVSEINLDKCMMEQNSLRAFYGAQAAYAEAQAARVKTRFEVTEASLYDEHRRGLAASGEKVTEKMVENAVKLDSRWLAAKENLIEADTIANVNKALVMSIVDRRDMIIQLGADRRDENKGAARIMEREQIASRAREAMGSALSQK